MFTLTSPRVNKTPKKLEEGSSLSTSAKDGDNSEPDPSSSSKINQSTLVKTTQNKCLFCGAVHKLDNCTDFCRMPFSQRRDFFFH